MIVLLDTSTPVCRLMLVDGDARIEREWQADRTLAKKLLEWLNEQLASQNKSWADISGIGVFRGPGSFTGLRIGLTVLNTLAGSLSVPIVGAEGDVWREQALQRLHDGHDDRLVLPYYNTDANITAPRK